MEQNYNNNYNGYNGYTEQQPVYAAEEAPKKKSGKGKFGKAVALIAAVAVISGGAGFGGAMIAANAIGTTSPAAAEPANEGRINATYNLDDNKEDTEKRSSDENVSSALAAISDSDDVKTDKVYPTSVKPTGANGEYTASELYEAVNDTIVLVKVYKKSGNSGGYSYYDYYFGYGDDWGSDGGSKSDELNYSGYGSGIVFTEDGYILTNAHIVDGSDKLMVEVNDYNDPDTTHEYEAKVIGSDTSTDVAVIKIDRDEPFIPAKIGNSDSLKVGQDVCVIGNPGLSANIMFAHTMTKGVVSGLDVECLADNGYSIGLIQTDAAINSGNSGGGMFDMYGNVVGVVNSKIIATTYEGLGFALTINEAKPIMEDLLNYGYVKSRPVLGITTVELTEYRAQLYGAKLSKGLLVSDMNADAPVAKSGLRVADIITKINGKNVETVSDVQAIIGKFKVGDTVTATVARENDGGGVDSIDIDIILAESKN